MMRLILPLLLFSSQLMAEVKPALAEIQRSTEAFIESLEDDKRDKATFPFKNAERENWHFTPRDRKGLLLRGMNEAQKHAAGGIVTSMLSKKGAYQATQIIMLEGVLAVLEKNPKFRDVEKYSIAIFGTPGDKHGWGLRFEGHHLSLNFTVIDGDKVSVTPTFMGANPGEVVEGEHKGIRPLVEEELLARALVVSLLEAGKKKVLFSAKPPRDILTSEQRSVKPLEAVGVTLDDLSEAQTKALFELITTFTHRYRPEIAESELKAIREAGKVHFGWAGGTKPGEAYYYRIQGPAFVIETANTQNKANHIHTVWREFDGDFGRDLLKEHLNKHP